MQQPPVIYSERADLRDAVSEELKALGAEEIRLPANPQECIEYLIESPEAVLVLDWDLGSEKVNLILGGIKGRHRIEVRPVFLVVSEFDPKVIATGYEYGVSQIHSGPISRHQIKECLEELIRESEENSGVREELIRVAEARAHDDWAIATAVLQRLAEQYPNNERVKLELAENLIQEDRWQDAREILEPMAQQEEPNVRALHLMGRCLAKAGEYDGAIAYMERAKVINPHNVERLIDLGHAFLATDQIDQAKESFDEAIRIDEDNADAKMGKGQALLMDGALNEALRLLKGLSGPRELASIFNTAAVLSMRHGRFPKGMALYQAALGVLGKNDKIASRLFFNMGLGYKRQSLFDKALACFDKASELDPSYEKASKHRKFILGVLEQKGRLHDAPKEDDERERSTSFEVDGDMGNVFSEDELTALRDLPNPAEGSPIDAGYGDETGDDIWPSRVA